MAPRQRFPTQTVDEPPPIMEVASAASSTTSTSPTNAAGTAPLLLADNNNDEDSSPQPLRSPSRESSFSDEDSSDVSLTSTKSCSKSQPLKNVAVAYPNAATAAAVSDEASEIAREQHDFFNLIALVRFGKIQRQKYLDYRRQAAKRFDP
jgi:hypothetical protein